MDYGKVKIITKIKKYYLTVLIDTDNEPSSYDRFS